MKVLQRSQSYIIRHTELRRGRKQRQCYGGVDGTKSDGGVAYRFLITLLDKRFVYKLLMGLANYLRCSTHRQYLHVYQCFVLISFRTLLHSVWHFISDLSLGESFSLQNSEASSVSLFPCLSSSLLLMCPLHSHHSIFAWQILVHSRRIKES